MDTIQSAVTTGARQAANYAPVTQSVGVSVANESEIKTASVVEPTKAQVSEAIGKINAALQDITSTNLKFMTDEGTGMRVVQVVDASTKEVIRQIPTKEVINIASGLDKLQGLLIRKQA